MCSCRIFARVLERGADGHGEQRVLRHDLADRPGDVGLESQIAVREDAEQPPLFASAFGDGHAGDAVLLHQVHRLVDAVLGRERDRVHDHAALRPLHAIDLGGLLLDRQVLVDHPDGAVLRHGDRQQRLGDGVHRRADERHVERDVAGEPCRDVDLVRHDLRVLGHEQHVVEGEGSGDGGAEVDGRGRGLQFHVSHPFGRAVTARRRDTSCISCRCRRDTGRSGRPSVPRASPS